MTAYSTTKLNKLTIIADELGCFEWATYKSIINVSIKKDIPMPPVLLDLIPSSQLKIMIEFSGFFPSYSEAINSQRCCDFMYDRRCEV